MLIHQKTYLTFTVSEVMEILKKAAVDRDWSREVSEVEINFIDGGEAHHYRGVPSVTMIFTDKK